MQRIRRENREIGYRDQRPFRQYLSEKKGLKESTVDTYDLVVYYFFCYMKDNYDDFDPTNAADDIVVNDVRNYLSYLMNEKGFSVSTRNKQLTALRSFFMYCYDQRIIRSYPIHEIRNLRKVKPEDVLPNKPLFDAWIDNLPEYLMKEESSMIARALLLFISKGYGVSRQIQPGFYHELENINLSEVERNFLEEYLSSIKELQTYYKTKDIFLKERVRSNKEISNPVLVTRQLAYMHLKRAEKIWGFPVVPRKLLKQVRLRMINDNPKLNDGHLMEKMDVTYYQLIELKEEAKLAYGKQETSKL